jgi:predicted peptidase
MLHVVSFELQADKGRKMKHGYGRCVASLILACCLASCLFARPAGVKKPSKGAYDVITQEQTKKLKAIRNSYGSITKLDKLYTNRKHKNGLPYHIYVPKDLKPGKKYPLVTFLHGYSDLTIDTHKGFPKGVWSLPLVQKDHPHILFVPRYRTFKDMWVQEKFRSMVIEALDDLVKEFSGSKKAPNIDPNRLYLTGFSQGGMGTWNYIRTYPKKFAAAAPLSGFSHGPQNIAQAKEIKNIPIWIFNGDGDRGVGGSRLSFKMLKQAGARDVRYHEYKKQGHVIDDFAYFTKGFMNWFFSQKRTSRKPVNPSNTAKSR